MFVLVEDDLFFRQYAFHTQKLVLHRASMRRFATVCADAAFDVEVIDTDAGTATGAAARRAAASGCAPTG